MSSKNNRFEYGCYMDEKSFKQMADSIKYEVYKAIDFKNGIVQEVKEKENTGIVMDVRWKKDIHLILFINRWTEQCLCYVLRNEEQISQNYYIERNDKKFSDFIQHLVNQIENGDFDNKKTESEKIAEIIKARNLTACMNNTKWKEFIKAINEEMSVLVPCDYLTLFGSGPFFAKGFDYEHLGYKLKSIEWVKVKPKFYISKYRGRLVEDDKELCDAEQEFLNLMDKYSIPYEYDSINEIYTIYGYR